MFRKRGPGVVRKGWPVQGGKQVVEAEHASPNAVRKPCPEANANPISRLFLGWVFGLVLAGWKKPLQDPDLWELRHFERASYTTESVLSLWRRYNAQGRKKNRLFSSVFHANRTAILTTAALKLVDVSLFLILPVFIERLVAFVQTEEDEDGNLPPIGIGIAWSLSLLFIPLLKTIVESQYFSLTMRTGLRIRSSLQGVLYDKSLRMSPTARASASLGEIVNLMQLDSQRIGDFVQMSHVIWAAPIQIIVSVGLLLNYIGVSALIGLLATVATIPLQGFLIASQVKIRKATFSIVDKRVKLMNEILQGIKAVKFYAWEKPFSELVQERRSEEVRKLYQSVWIRAGFISILMAIPVIIAVITFAFYAGVFGEVLVAAKVFAGIAILNQLRVPVMMLPMVITQLVDTRIGLKRIERFLDLEDTDNYSRVKDADTTAEGPGAPVKTSDASVEAPGGSVDVSSTSDPKPAPDVKSSSEDSDVFDLPRGSITISKGEFEWSQIAENPLKVERKKGEKILGCFPRPRKSTVQKQTPATEKVQAPDPVKAEELPKSEDPVQAAVRADLRRYVSRGTVLRDITIDFERGTLNAIVGYVGTGKSSLLHAILGEMRKTNGSVSLEGSVAYVAQTAWIFNDTLKNNILFGKEYDEQLYQKAIRVSALEQDLNILPAGDMTAIGEKGINLSGGQKQRVSIARAVYADADVYLMDDPLSALDAHVSGQVFDMCMSNDGVLKDRLRVLVTNQVHILPNCDKIVFLNHGTVQCSGKYSELVASDKSFLSLVRDHEDAQQKEKNTIEDGEGNTVTSTDSKIVPIEVKDVPEAGKETVSGNEAGRKLIQSEERNVGKVGVGTYWEYIRALGNPIVFLLLLVFFIASAAMQLVVQWWLAYWSSEEAKDIQNGDEKTSDRLGFFLGIYFAIAIGYAIAIFIRTVWYLWQAIYASKTLHNDMLRSILRAPLTFFDTTPIGRVISRFSRDISALDEQLPQFFQQALNTSTSLIMSYIFIGRFIHPFFGFAIPVTIFYFFLQRFFNRTALELKRLDAISKSPIYAHFSETLGGLSTLRAYSKQEQSRAENMVKIDLNQRAYFSWVMANRWFTLYLEMVGSLLIYVTAVFSVLARETISPAIIGLVLIYATQVTQYLGFTVRSITEMEGQMSSVERANYYRRDLPQERPDEVEGAVSKSWPATGNIVFENVEMRYRDGLPLVLKGVNLSINGGEKVGVVGRTGSGKSSLMIALLQMVDIAGGSITVDGVDLASVGLNDVRKRMTIIPQDPVMFSGTIRFNLDPFGEYSDAQVWDALEKSHLKNFVAGLDEGLDAEVTEYGENLSAGQRQVICLTRALLRNTKIMVLDEASSQLDMETDRLIQDAIRTHLKDATILTIAHRLLTLADYDKIVVMEDGIVAECGSPLELLDKRHGKFRALVNSMGAAGAAHFRQAVLRV